MTDDEITIERDKQATEAWADFTAANTPTTAKALGLRALFHEGFVWGWDAAETFLENQWKSEVEFLRAELLKRA